ncbi:hypothetical protein [uncultured Ruthenibacterium sp.]
MQQGGLRKKRMDLGHRAAFSKGRHTEYGSGCALVWGNRVSV